jgi:hypothetical protein
VGGVYLVLSLNVDVKLLLLLEIGAGCRPLSHSVGMKCER